MTARTTLADTTRKARMGSARATIREFDDGHLMQEIAAADVYHSETPTNFERFQTVGMTAVPLKQQDDPKQKTTPAGNAADGDWNHDQPKGPAAEAVMLYLGGSRSHPVALVDDRRVRPYNMKAGEGAHYAPDGSEQMTFFNKDGAYLVSLDGKSVADPKGNATRMASLRHVKKKMQTHKIEEGEKQEAYKHEGESVNTEVRVTANRIEFFSGDKSVGSYDKSSNVWTLNEVGGNFKVIVDGNKILCQYQDNSMSFRVDKDHTHMRFKDNKIFVDKDGCWSSVAINVKDDPYD